MESKEGFKSFEIDVELSAQFWLIYTMVQYEKK